MATRLRRGFSLVELLVVISIIALLIAILLPILASVREGAGIQVCNSNLAGIGKGQLAYAMDNDGDYTMSTEWVWGKGGKYPDGTTVGNGANGKPRHSDPTVVKNIEQGTIYPYYPVQEAFVCPVAIKKLPWRTDWDSLTPVRSYSQNGEAGPSASREWRVKGWTQEEQADTLERPMDFAIFVEENTFSIAGWNAFHTDGMNDALFRLQPFDYDQLGSFHKTGSDLGEPNSSGYYDPDEELCSGVSYAVMADGHVEQVNYKGKIKSGPYRNTKWSRMWCKDAIPVERE